jgi:hypothetical protein
MPPDLSIQTEIDRLAIKQFVKQQSITKPIIISELNRTLVKKDNASLSNDDRLANENMSTVMNIEKSIGSNRGQASMLQNSTVLSMGQIPSRSQTDRPKRKIK